MAPAVPKLVHSAPAPGERAGGPASQWFRAFYDAQVDFVRRAVARLGGPSADADDLVQQVFLVAHRRWPTLPAGSDPRGWLHGVALRVVSQSRRRHKLRRFVGLESGLEALANLADEETPDEVLERTEQNAQLYRLLDRLPEKKRAVLILHEIEELSCEEIAAILRCPLGTVWTRLFHARKAFERAAARTGRLGESR